MSHSLGIGLFGSLKARVNKEIRDLARQNQTLRRSRYSVSRRLARALLVNRSIWDFFGAYIACLLLALVCEWGVNRYDRQLLPGYDAPTMRDFLENVGSYLLAAQVGVLAIVSVAVAVVTLLSDRDDASSINTDIRLYYVESYSYELAVSGVALLIVLTIQLFWPLQHILHAAGLGGRDYSFKLALTALHALWLSLNLMLFLQFIITTLRFVEPNSRETLRERYSANEVIPRDARTRLLRALYYNAPSQLFGDQALKDGPYISFGHGMGLDDTPVAEITTVFSRPTQLIDVRLRPLHWALARWQKRVRTQIQQKHGFGQPLWDAQLTILPNFDSVLEGHRDWVLRRGGPPLTGIEKWVIRQCFRFKAAVSHETDMPTPENFLEQLVEKVVQQTEKSATTGFRSALTEVIQYHSFILAAQNTRDDAGNAFNLAEVGTFFTRPDAEWVRQYRRAFVAAADKIGIDTYFIDRLSSLVTRLLPDDALNFSPRVIQTLLELGAHEVVALEGWVTKRAVIGATENEVGASATLTGSDKRAYENALIGFVGGWENVLQTLISSFGIERRPLVNGAAEQWTAFAKSFPVLQAHLHNAAYFLASAVWNDDALGADRFRDLLLRWLHPFYANLQEIYIFSNTFLVTPDLVNQDWQTAHTEVTSRMRFRQEAALPGRIFGCLLWELHCDSVCISGLVALHWYATGEQPSETAAQAAVLTLRREKRESDGSDLIQTTQKSTFRLLFDFAIRYALNPRFAESHYSATIDGLVQYLTNLSAPRMVSGRIYGRFGIDGFETLRPVLLAAMAANLPPEGENDIAKLVENLKGDSLFQSDKSIRSFIWTIQQVVSAIPSTQDGDLFRKAASAFGTDVDLETAIPRLRDILGNVVAAFEELRKERLRTAPLDEDRMELVRRHITEGVLANGPTIACFRGYQIRRDNTGEIAVDEFEFGVMDKGAFVIPEMSEVTFDELPGMFVEVCRGNFNNFIWRDLYQQPKRTVSVDVSDGTDSFWRRVIQEASTVGSDPMVLVPYSTFGEEIFAAAQPIVRDDRLVGFSVSHEANMPSGGGTGYMGTIEGVHVYSAQVMSSNAVLCSSRLLRAIDYGVVHGTGDIADFEFVEGEDLRQSRVRLIFAQRTEWAGDVLVEFQITGMETGIP